MKAETATLIQDIKQSLELLRRHLDWDNALYRLEEINSLTADANLWNNPEQAQKLMAERTYLEDSVKGCRDLEQGVKDAEDLIELGEAEGDDEIVAEAEASLADLQKQAQKQTLNALLSGEADSNDTYLEIHAGAGGTEAQDWSEMLLRMYMRWAEKHDFKVEYLEASEGEEAGIKSSIIKISGHNAYGWLKTESGVHRLVRISPYDANARRHTSFSSVWVYPVIDDSIKIDINPADCKIDTYRSSGAGGQHVNKTESAIRMTHIPTGIVVECQDERSQIKNREKALKVLKSRVYDFYRSQAEKEYAENRRAQVGTGDRSERIRTYNFPQGRVTDHRIGLTLYNIDKFMLGDLDEMISALQIAVQNKMLENIE
ncbi:MAG TPA: peptide chain release factor 2 [Clostridiales bacterium]|nr:peptide chain release factor 2 [Clostridiales bacterium]